MSEVEITYDTENVDIGPQGPPGPPGSGSGTDDAIRSVSAPGGYIITNIRLNSDKKIVITYDDTPVT
jgi:hypothetical protein